MVAHSSAINEEGSKFSRRAPGGLVVGALPAALGTTDTGLAQEGNSGRCRTPGPPGAPPHSPPCPPVGFPASTPHPAPWGVSLSCIPVPGHSPSPLHSLPWSGGPGLRPPASIQQQCLHTKAEPIHQHALDTPSNHKLSRLFAHRMPTGKTFTERREEGPDWLCLYGKELACNLQGSLVKR